MRRTLVLLVLALALLVTGLLQAQNPPRLRIKVVAAGGGSTPLSRNEHPRMWVTEDNIAAIRARVSTGGGLNTEAATWVSWLDSNYSTTWGLTTQNYAVAHYAFAYLLLRDGTLSGLSFANSASDYGNLAADLLLDYIADNSGQMADDRTAQTIIAYDWAWPFFSAGEKDTIEAWMKTSRNTVSAPGSVGNVVDIGYRITSIICGLALLGDGQDDAWAQAKIDEYADLFTAADSGLFPAQEAFGGGDGAGLEGPSYTYNYYNEWVFLLTEAWRTANGISLSSMYAADMTFLTQQARAFTYVIPPFGPTNGAYPGGREFRFEKGNYTEAAQGVNDSRWRNWIYVARGLYTHDSNIPALAQWLIENRVGVATTEDSSMLRYWVPGILVFGPENDPTASSPTTLALPTSKVMGDGRIFLRDDWTSVTKSLLIWTFAKYFSTPYHSQAFCPGNFDIHRKGPMVGRHGGITGHDWGGGGNAGACNSMLFVDSNVTYSSDVSDPGIGSTLTSTDDLQVLQWSAHRSIQHLTGLGADALTAANGHYDARDDFATVLADRAAGRDFDYVFGDITRSYNSSRFNDNAGANMISEAIRQMVNLRPATAGTDAEFLIVYDRSTTLDTDFERRWVIHLGGAATVDGSSAAGPSRNGSTGGHVTYTGATTITATNTTNSSDGKVWVTPLLPTAFSIVEVGGNSSDAQSWTSGADATPSREYVDPFGVNWTWTKGGASPSADVQQYVQGRHRYETIPTTSSLTDPMLHVIETADSGASPTTKTLVGDGSSTFQGVIIGDRIVLFHKTSGAATSGTFVLPTAGTWRVLITGLSAGSSRTVTGGTSIQSIDPVDTSSPFTVNTPVQDAVTGSTIGGWLYLTIVTSTTNVTITIS